MKDSSNSKVFNWCWNNRSVDTTVFGSEFQICEAAIGKAQPLMVESLNEVRSGDLCWQSGVFVDQVCQQHE